MWLLQFYRFYLSAIAAIAGYLFLIKKSWFGTILFVAFRGIYAAVEYLIGRYRTTASFTKQVSHFKQMYGPYGIRIANKAERDFRVKKSLYEVFTDDMKLLKKNVESLEMMETLFKAGLRPEGDDYLLHDLKLKFGRHRLEGVKKPQ